jgi:GTPase SAR1 family protein
VILLILILEQWYEECRAFNPGIPIVVLATKIDQRAGTLRAWNKAQGHALSRSIRATAFLECSAVTGEGIEEVFQTIIRVAKEAQFRSRY